MPMLTKPGGTNEAFDRTHFHAATIVVIPDNACNFDVAAAGQGDLMITDATEPRLHRGPRSVVCAVHPDHLLEVNEKVHLLARDVRLQQWVGRFLHMQRQSGALDAPIANSVE